MNEFKYLFKITCEDSEITIDMVLNTAKLKYKEMYGVNVEVQTNEDDNYSFSEYTFVDDNNKHKKKLL